MVTLLRQNNLKSLVQPMILRILDFGLIERLGLDMRRAFWALWLLKYCLYLRWLKAVTMVQVLGNYSQVVV
jgi:hypothetical protein